MPSRVISAPFIVLAVLFGALAFLVDGGWAYWIIPNFIVLAVIYSLHPQIDWAWYVRRPPEMDDRLVKLVSHTSPFYQNLNRSNQKKFRDRTQLYLLANEYFLRGPEDNITPPDDLKALFAIPLVELTFAEEENWRLQKFERLVLYPTSFPSPRIHELHACEIETEDGVIIAALDLARLWVEAPTRAFPLMHYVMAKAYLWSFMEKRSALTPHSQWDAIQRLAGRSQEDIQKLLGAEDIDVEALYLALSLRNGRHPI